MEITDTSIADRIRAHERLFNGSIGVTDESSWDMQVVAAADVPWKQNHFHHVLGVMRGLHNMTENILEEVLVVKGMPNMREMSNGEVEFETDDLHAAKTTLYIKGLPNISKYCYSNNTGIVPHEWKTSLVLGSERIQNLSIVDIQSKVVQHTKIQEEEVYNWSDLPKYHMLKKEFVYQEKGSPVKYIISMIRESNDVTAEMVDSGVDKNELRFEFGVRAETKVTAEEMMSNVLRLQMLLTREPLPVDIKVRQAVFQEYCNTIQSAYYKPPSVQNPRSAFLAPKPITLERKNLLPVGSGLGIITILDGYTVTDKADGERMLLYIAADGEGYFIDNALTVRASGWRTSKKELFRTVIDGEYIPVERQHRTKDYRDLYAAFDIYFLGEKNVMSMPLLTESATECRYNLLKNVMDNKWWKEHDEIALKPVSLSVKNMVAANGDEMFAACKKMLEGSNDLPYNIDGLIFTPAKLPVFGYYANRPVLVGAGMAWDRVFKWKPETMNSIDFLVIPDNQGLIVADDGNGGLKKYKSVEIYTGYRPASWEDITPMNGLRMRYDKDKAFKEENKKRNDYEKRLFRPLPIWEDGIEIAYIPVDDAGIPRTEEGQAIVGQTIVEFAYNKDDTRAPSFRWSAMRVREDKTRLYRRDEKIGGAANDFSTAMNIWRSIHDPVTQSMIMGNTKVLRQDGPPTLEDAVGADDVYYARQVPREHCYSRQMLDFHNIGIKKMLYDGAPHEALLELACGKAGDLGRWREYGFSFVLGVDVSRDNITSPSDGAYARMLDHRRGTNMIQSVDGAPPKFVDIVFAVGDCAKPLETGEAAGDDEESRKVLRMVYGTDRPQVSWLRPVAGKAKRRFQTVACQFAIHYFFSSPQNLDGFLRNVSNNLVPGGVFVGTCMDGERVDALLNKSGNVAQGKKEDTVVWAITKDYIGKLEENDAYGKKVHVYLEMTHQTIAEYLVHFSFLVEKAKEYGLHLVNSETFDVTFNRLRNQVPVKESERKPFDKSLVELGNDDVQKQFSFLNRWFKFEKKNYR